MARKQKSAYVLDNSPFFNKEEIKTKAKLTPLSYNEKEDYYITKKVIYKSDEYVKHVIEKRVNFTEYHKLSTLSKTLIYYIVTDRLKYNSLTFELEAEIFSKIVNVKSINKIYDAINELIKFKYIARTDIKEVYWINHNRYYKGNYLVIKHIEN